MFFSFLVISSMVSAFSIIQAIPTVSTDPYRPCSDLLFWASGTNVENGYHAISAIDCLLYFSCADNRVTDVAACPAGTAFNNKCTCCQVQDTFPCRSTSPDDAFCIGKADGLYEDATDSTYYYICVSEAATRIACPDGYYFTNGGCTPIVGPTSPLTSPTTTATSPTTTATSPTTPPTSPTTTTLPPTSPTTAGFDADVLCQFEADGALLVHPTDCTLFIHCSHGSGYVKDCPLGTAWDPRFSTCNHKDMVQC